MRLPILFKGCWLCFENTSPPTHVEWAINHKAGGCYLRKSSWGSLWLPMGCPIVLHVLGAHKVKMILTQDPNWLGCWLRFISPWEMGPLNCSMYVYIYVSILSCCQFVCLSHTETLLGEKKIISWRSLQINRNLLEIVFVVVQSDKKKLNTGNV